MITVHVNVTHADGEYDTADISLPDDTDVADVRKHAIEQWGGNFIPGDVIDLTIEGHMAPLDSFTIKTWTFVGHWEDDRIVVEYVLPGEQQDQREDMGYWEQGLWAAAGYGVTMEEARKNVLDEYEAEYRENDEPLKQWIVNGTSMVVEAATAEDAVERAEQVSGWHWEATRVCPRHGGPWGSDETCTDCTTDEGNPR